MQAPVSLPSLKRARCAAAGLLLDHGGIDRAFEFHDAFGYRAGCPLGHDPRNSESAVYFVGVTAIEVTFVVLEGELATSRCDVDIARLADDGINRNGDLIHPPDDGPLAIEQA